MKQEKDHSDQDSNYGETIVKQEKDHSDGDSKDGETIVKQEDHSGGDTNDVHVKEEMGETRHWVVCDGRFLNEIKKPHAWSV